MGRQASLLGKVLARAIGARLRTLRKARGLTLADVSRASQVDVATISRIEQGQMSGTLECHLRLAIALGMRLTVLYRGIQDAIMKHVESADLPVRAVPARKALGRPCKRQELPVTLPPS